MDVDGNVTEGFVEMFEVVGGVFGYDYYFLGGA